MLRTVDLLEVVGRSCLRFWSGKNLAKKKGSRLLALASDSFCVSLIVRGCPESC